MLVTERKRGWKDAFAAVRLALSPNRLLLGVLGLLVIRLLWFVYPRNLEHGFGCLLVNVIWLSVSLFCLYAVLAGIGRSVYLELDEGEGPGLAESVRFTLSHGVPTALSVVIFLVGALVLLALAAIGFLLARIPSVGTMLGAVLYFPMLVFVVLGGLALVLAVFGLYVAPGAAGVRRAGALDTFLDTLDLFSGRGVFWGFLLTLAGMYVLSRFLALFYALANVMLSIGGGLEPLELPAQWWGEVAATLAVFRDHPQTALLVEETRTFATAARELLWTLVFELFRLFGFSYLAGIFAASGVVAYIVGTEDEVVVVEEKREAEAIPGPAVPAAPEVAEAAGESEVKEEEKPVAMKRPRRRRHSPKKESGETA